MKKFLYRVVVVSGIVLATSTMSIAGGRGGGSGGIAGKLSGPGPFYPLGFRVGAPLFCRDCLQKGDDDASRGPMPESGAWKPRWLDVSFTLLLGEDDFEGTNVHGVTVESSVEWAFMTAVERDVAFRERIFFGVGYAITNYRGEEFEDFWRASIVPRAGLQWGVLEDKMFRVGGGLNYYPTAFTHGEFGAAPTANDHWSWFVFAEFLFGS